MVGIGGRISRMTSESTSLASRETTREQWAHYFAFVRKPDLPLAPERSFKAGMGAILQILALDFAAMSALLVIAAIVMAVGFELPQTALAGLKIDWRLAVMVVVVAPLLEEILFRGWLSGKPGHLLAIAILLLGGMIAAMLPGAMTAQAAHLPVITASLGAVALAVAGLIILRRRGPMHWFRAIFPIPFWLSTLAFATVHLLNFDEGNLVALLPLVLPQFILGTMLGYLRVNYGLWSSITLHALHNGLIIAVVAVASAGAG